MLPPSVLSFLPSRPSSKATREQSLAPSDASGSKQRASKRYQSRKMLSAVEEPLSARLGSPLSRHSSSTPLSSFGSDKRRYATRGTKVAVLKETPAVPQMAPARIFKSPSKRQVLFTLRQRLSVESVPVNQIPSFMDHFLNYQSPSVDFDSEEIMLEIACRIKLNKLDHMLGATGRRRYLPYTGDASDCIQIVMADEDASSIDEDGSDLDIEMSYQSRLPDSFERSTSSWTET